MKKEYNYNELVVLMDSFRYINQIQGITGILLYHHGNLIQLFEGPIEKTKQLYDNIINDNRHTKVIKMLHHKIDKRTFPDWYMGLVTNDTSKHWNELNFLETLSITDVKIKMILDTFKRICRI
jgi:hypothetical protein